MGGAGIEADFKPQAYHIPNLIFVIVINAGSKRRFAPQSLCSTSILHLHKIKMYTQLGSSSLCGASLSAQIKSVQQPRASRAAVTTPRALFTKQRPAPVVEEKPAKKSFSLFAKKAAPAPIVEEKPAKKSFSLFAKKTAPAPVVATIAVVDLATEEDTCDA